MKVFTSNDFEGQWPVGTAAVIVAESETHARQLLEACHPLAAKKPYTVRELDLSQPAAVVLSDGNY